MSIKVKVTVHADLSAAVKVLEMPASHLNENTMEGQRLHPYLSKLSSFHVCTGITDPTLQHFSKPPSAQSSQTHFLHTTLVCPDEKPYITSCVRSASCLLLSEELICKPCTKTIPLLQKQKNRADEREKNKLHKNTPLNAVSHTTLKKEVKELRKTNSALEKELETIRKKIEQESITLDSELHEDLNKIISTHESEINDDLVRLFWQEQSKAFQRKERGIKWHPMMIRLALLIHSKGPSVYNTLRDTGILKLPGETTLRDYSNYIHPQPGFNPQVIEELKEQANKLPEDQRFVALLHDEMSVKEDLVWDSKTGELVGFVNLNQWQEQPDSRGIASHILVFYVVGINSSLKYSMGYFGTKTATSDEIYPLFWEAVGILECTCQLKVISSTSDKASTNQRFYQMHGEPTDICYKTSNWFADRYIYFFSDVPHLIKTVRNNLYHSGPGKSRLLWYNGKELLWSHVRRIYEEDKTQQLTRKHKLTNDHINLTSHSMMNVKLAAQVLSKSVGSILGGDNYEDCHETGRLINYMNRFFDCLNTRSLDEASRKKNVDLKPYTDKNDTRFQFLDDFLAFLSDWKESVRTRPGNFDGNHRAKMFLSHQTYKGLVMTIRSFKEATQYLLDNGVQFVLSNRFCQDPLEAHFGRHRSLVPRSQNPNIHCFGFQENKLRIQRHLAMQIQPRGNVEKRKRGDNPVKVSNSPLKKQKH